MRHDNVYTVLLLGRPEELLERTFGALYSLVDDTTRTTVGRTTEAVDLPQEWTGSNEKVRERFADDLRGLHRAPYRARMDRRRPNRPQSLGGDPRLLPTARCQTDRQASPALFTALPEQAGLRLESRRVSLEVLVIDHVERPTPD